MSSYLWDDHKEEILSLYEEGMSIPVIHKKIRRGVFKISERVLYDKLKEWSLPTDRATRRERAARAKAMRMQNQVSTSESWSLPSNDAMLSAEKGSLGYLYGDMSCSSSAQDSFSHSGHLEELLFEAPCSQTDFDFNPTFVLQQAGSCITPKRPTSNDPSFTFEFEADDSQGQWSELRQTHGGQKADNLQQDPSLVQSSNSPRGRKRQSSTSLNQPTSRARTTGVPDFKGPSISYIHPAHIDSRSSLTSTDSGYAGSSRSSLCAQIPQNPNLVGTSDHEFAPLYKVACTIRHESAATYDLMPCEQCGFATLHGLAWHANKWPVEEFKRMINRFCQSKNIRDKAGNTALHYSAAKADFDYLFALIEFGVDCRQKNTRGQIFLHLIEPRTLDFDIFNLLNIPDVRILINCRDHLGQTVLHELCRKADTEARRKSILRYFESEGFPTGALNCFGQTAESACLQEPSFEPLARTANTESNQRRKEQDLDVVRQANSNPHYKHPETSSNIIHVLSRLQLKPNDRHKRLLKYIRLGTSLSDYNRDGDIPFILFACQRPDDELKVTTELYIESLLDALKDRGSSEVHMRNGQGETALHCACVEGSHFSVKLLIARGSNVNSVTFQNESILKATQDAQARAVKSNNQVKIDNFKEVIALLTRRGAVEYPSSLQERGEQSVDDQIANLSMT